MHQDAKDLRARGDRLFSQKLPLDARNQEIADNFFPERADFTQDREVGDSYAEHLTSGYPSMVRRSLGDALGSMLRPKSKNWFEIRTARWDKIDHEGRVWCEWATALQRRAMYDRVTQFTRAMKEGDHCFAAFGSTVISVEMNRRDNALLYRCWHLRDVAWAEDCYGQIGEVHVNWSPTACELVKLFKGKVHENVAKRAEKEPGAKVKVRRVVIRSDEAKGKKYRQPWVSVYIDCDNEHVMEERGSWTPIFVIPRWATISGSQYAYSPAAMIALPDARLLQAMTLTLLEAGEKTANPPLIGVGSAIAGEVNTYPGGFTAVDAEYDERLGEVLRPLHVDSKGLPFGVDMADRIAAQLREAFFLNTLSMPPHDGPEMTAFEVGKRVQEYIRNALPIFEPMEDEYNGQVCEASFETLMHEGAFGPPDLIPRSIRGQETQFAFDNPLSEMIEREKGQKFMEMQGILASMAEIDPTSLEVPDFAVALRDTLNGIGVPAKWLRSEKQIEQAKAAQADAQAAASALGQMQAGAEVAETLGRATKQFADARPA